MKKIIVLLLLSITFCTMTYGQISSDLIIVKKQFGSFVFYKDSDKLTLSQLSKIIKTNEEASKIAKQANTTQVFAVLTGVAGGAMLGYPIGAAMAGKKPNYIIAGVGAGLIVVSVPLSFKANRQYKKATDEYNKGLDAASFWDKTELKLSMTENGFGLTLKF